MEDTDTIGATSVGIGEYAKDVDVIGPKGRTIVYPTSSIRVYDFRQPPFLSTTEIRKLRIRHDEFVRSLASRLSMYPRLDVSLRLRDFKTLSYQDLIESLSTPTHLTLFKTEPLRGIGLLNIPPCLGLTIVDRLMGGTALPSDKNRDLTDIETALLDQAVQIILNEWCNQWQAFQDLRPSLLGHENNGRFLQTAPHDTVMVCIAIEVGIGSCSDQMLLAFPHYTLEPIVNYLTEAGCSEREVKLPAVVPFWNNELDEVTVGLSAEWDGVRMTVRELGQLELGQVLHLDSRRAEGVKIQIASITKYEGRLGTVGKNWAVELTKALAT